MRPFQDSGEEDDGSSGSYDDPEDTNDQVNQFNMTGIEQNI